ncbi:MAG: heparan-alpha-glucosaminide N-acetyltransferase domain-containing protein [Candidatus Hydrogenedentes bacterium]|nr:heparan-alpha-glucosaminide N-acetyltransferase domain-containing protein [Candidatus Hydrogenedentota bacterium]
MTIPKPVAPPPQSSRLVALDVLRGFDMFWIIGADAIGQALMKSTGGENAPAPIKFVADQLEHVSWEGFHFYDLIFPLFVFMVGMSSVFSLTKIIEKHGKASAIKRIARRAALLLILGAVYDAIDIVYWDGLAGIAEENLICGVLQRMALCYLATGLLLCVFEWRGLLATGIAMLACYWAALTFIPAPGEAQVVFERGNNIIHYIDKMIPPYYGTDPESLMTTFPAIVSCILGALTAIFLRETDLSEDQQAQRLLLVGVAMVVIGYLWGLQIPIIKRLWTPSYVFVAGGYSLMLLGAFIWMIDVKEWQWWIPPFLWIGSNSIAIYFFDNLTNFDGWANLLLGKDALAPGMQAALALFGLLLSIGFVYVLNKKKIYIRV